MICITLVLVYQPAGPATIAFCWVFYFCQVRSSVLCVHDITFPTEQLSRQQKHKQTKWYTLRPLWRHIGIRTKSIRHFLSWNLMEGTAALPKSIALTGRWNKKIWGPVRNQTPAIHCTDCSCWWSLFHNTYWRCIQHNQVDFSNTNIHNVLEGAKKTQEWNKKQNRTWKRQGGGKIGHWNWKLKTEVCWNWESRVLFDREVT